MHQPKSCASKQKVFAPPIRVGNKDGFKMDSGLSWVLKPAPAQMRAAPGCFNLQQFVVGCLWTAVFMAALYCTGGIFLLVLSSVFMTPVGYGWGDRIFPGYIALHSVSLAKFMSLSRNGSASNEGHCPASTNVSCRPPLSSEVQDQSVNLGKLLRSV